ncbi:MAG: ATPase [Nisaea sp.]|uniref:ATP12 family chaperone protein n=1 Tax=Nisaea sp. TaxID=2024842 RepID=UPI001B144181|nr:ATP12 family protein [Nisaea sp.]MBO6561756.1 ATPase [Nisaea sp.]
MKRFYKTASVGSSDGGYQVLLDGRPIRTPAKAQMLLPVETLAAAIASEWEAQGEKVEPGSMPFMSLAATGIDRVTTQREAVIDQIAAYGGSDLVCYRADAPADLAERQMASWQPLLDWAEGRFDARLTVTAGIMPAEQPEAALKALRLAVAAYDDLVLSGLYQLTTGLGSLIIALAVVEGRIDAGKGVELALLDELFQAERWGEDSEAAERRETLARDMENAARFAAMCRV